MSSTTTKQTKKSPVNNRLARRAKKVVESTGTDSRKAMCQKAIRESIQQEYGGRYNKYHAGNAITSMRRWKDSPYAVAPAHGSVVGDILYQGKSAGDPRGHVGIRVPGNMVAENGSRSSGRVRGGYGFVSLEDFGRVDLIVRLPENPDD